jgi:methylenetetrahydrofolate dehydrogenase (NADP+)/methenyltetrahydrofolate cyclohydrolase
VIDGRALADSMLSSLRFGSRPGLAVVLVGDDPASLLYTEKKMEACRRLGIHCERHELPVNAHQADAIAVINRLNSDDNIHGILVQLPLPGDMDRNLVLSSVMPEKDVDGFHPLNIGRLVSGKPYLVPATPLAVMKIIESTGTVVKGKHAVVVGHSIIVGRPLSFLLLNAGATVTVCHEYTRDLSSHTRSADILVSATGIPRLIRKDMVKQGALVIDVGISRQGKKIVGDVDFNEVKKVTDLITPVPGGVGPVTIACLLENTVKAQTYK